MLTTELYTTQNARWPRTGRHILAQFDAETVLVYQAFRPGIGQYAARHGSFGGSFRLGRMSWIKPNFLWMMYRCGWASKESQETVLAVRLNRTVFDALLAQAVPSSYVPTLYATPEEWQAAVTDSEVRLQWDPDHDPFGAKVERRALQIGLRGETLRRYAREWIVGIEDVTDFVRQQSLPVQSGDLSGLLTPREDVYPLPPTLAAWLGVEPVQKMETTP